MTRCKKCVMPNTRPDTEFVDGVCSACISYEKRKDINWEERENDLIEICKGVIRSDSGYDCIVPSSGGKDSTWQVLKVIELGLRPLVVTATTCHLTDIGRRNIDNLARYATTIEVSPNKVVRAKLNRLGMTMVGDISWPEHVSIFTTPFKVAVAMGIPLIIYGENPQNQYGGPLGADEAVQMTRRWVSEYGGFLGMRPGDVIGFDGITEADMQDYMPPSDADIDRVGVRALFLGQYIEWDSHRNAKVAIEHGMLTQMPCLGNWWRHENLDNGQTGIHDYFGWLKYGYTRGCAQISVDVRAGLVTREFALNWISHFAGGLPGYYMGVPLEDVLSRIGTPHDDFMATADQFTNRDI